MKKLSREVVDLPRPAARAVRLFIASVVLFVLACAHAVFVHVRRDDQLRERLGRCESATVPVVMSSDAPSSQLSSVSVAASPLLFVNVHSSKPLSDVFAADTSAFSPSSSPCAKIGGP